jgi:hypothetical protein
MIYFSDLIECLELTDAVGGEYLLLELLPSHVLLCVEATVEWEQSMVYSEVNVFLCSQSTKGHNLPSLLLPKIE